MAQRTMRPIETEADRYWREKIDRRGYGVELAVLAMFLTILILN